MPSGVQPDGTLEDAIASYGSPPTWESTACRLASRKSSSMTFGSGATPG